jgi:hypothetical protein
MVSIVEQCLGLLNEVIMEVWYLSHDAKSAQGGL